MAAVRSGAVDDRVTRWAADGTAHVAVTVRNTGDRAGTEVVQLYLHDPVAQTTRPVVRLVGYFFRKSGVPDAHRRRIC